MVIEVWFMHLKFNRKAFAIELIPTLTLFIALLLEFPQDATLVLNMRPP